MTDKRDDSHIAAEWLAAIIQLALAAIMGIGAAKCAVSADLVGRAETQPGMHLATDAMPEKVAL